MCVFEDWGFHRRELEMVKCAPFSAPLSQYEGFLGFYFVIIKKPTVYLQRYNSSNKYLLIYYLYIIISRYSEALEMVALCRPKLYLMEPD